MPDAPAVVLCKKLWWHNPTYHIQVSLWLIIKKGRKIWPSSDNELFMSRTLIVELSTWKVRRLNQLRLFEFETAQLFSRLAQPGISALKPHFVWNSLTFDMIWFQLNKVRQTELDAWIKRPTFDNLGRFKFELNSTHEKKGSASEMDPISELFGWLIHTMKADVLPLRHLKLQWKM